MSIASAYAAAIASEMTSLSAVEATVPAPFVGPGGLMTCSVTRDGNGELVFGGKTFPAPAAVLLAFAAWINLNYA